MAKYEREVHRTITETEEVVECDYCRLITTDDIDEGESFNEILLNPRSDIRGSYLHTAGAGAGMFEHFARQIVRADTKHDAMQIIRNLVSIDSESDADICPRCTESLFGEGPATGIRTGTGLLEGADD